MRRGLLENVLGMDSPDQQRLAAVSLRKTSLRPAQDTFIHVNVCIACGFSRNCEQSLARSGSIADTLQQKRIVHKKSERKRKKKVSK